MSVHASTKQDKILKSLDKAYPRGKIALKSRTAWELLVVVMLSAQCTDKRVNQVTEKLFKKYVSLDDYVNAKRGEFEQDIKSTGFYRNKAKNISASAKLIKDKFRGKVPNTMQDLTSLPGVGRKTANIILTEKFGKIEGIAIDTHASRLSQRLRLVNLEAIGGKRGVYFTKGSRELLDYKKDAKADKIEKELINILPKAKWSLISYQLMSHGRSFCKAQKPACERCFLKNLCPVSRE